MTIFKFFLLSSIAVAVNSQGCSICGDGKKVTAPDAVFSFPGQPSVPCGALELAGEQGQIPLAQCGFIPPLVTECECAPAAAVAPPTESPVAPPTDAPITPLPISPRTSSPVAVEPTTVAIFTVSPFVATVAPVSGAPVTDPPVAGSEDNASSDAPVTGPPVEPPSDFDATLPDEDPTPAPVKKTEPDGATARGTSGTVDRRSMEYLLTSSFVVVNVATLVLLM